MKTAKSSRILSLLALVLIAAMMLTMVGCGGNKQPDEDDNPTGNVSTEPGDTDATEPGDTGATDLGDTDATDDGATDATEPGETDATEPGDTTSATGSTTGKVINGTTGKTTGTTGKVTNGKNTTTKGVVGLRTTTSTKKTTKKTTTTTKRTTNKDNDILSKVPSSLSGTNIKMMIWWNAGTDDTNEAATFQKETGIKVTYETSAMDKYQQNLSAKVMAKNAPALAAIISEWYPQPITRHLMQPIDNVSGWNFKDEDVYALSLMDQFGLDGKHYGIALKGSNMSTFEVMFFNKEILDDCGVKIGKDDPYTLWKAGKWNWDSCLKIAQQCTDDKKGLKGITNTSQFFWMLSAGTDFVKADINGMKSNMDDPTLLNAWNYNWDLINTYKVIDTSYTAATPFFQGKAAMFGGGSFEMQVRGANYVPKNMTDDWGVVPFPSPDGKTAACEGTVWGFPETVKGDKLQAGAWFLRYFLDDYNYSARDFFPSEECWEVMAWMWNQKIQSYNSVGVLTYGGEYTAWSIQYSLVDEADTKAKMKSNLDQWKSVLNANIEKIKNEL